MSGKIRPAFSNGTEFIFFEDYNCSKCVKASRYNENKDEYTKFRCKVQEEIIKAAISDGMVSNRVADITHDFTLHGRNCKYLKTERKKYVKQNKNQLELFNQ